MITETTSGVKISVKTRFLSTQSDPENDAYFFAYTIRIENENPFRVQLISRHWFIFDALGPDREVEGAGVIGAQPVIKPDDYHIYTSGCDLTSEYGSMHGYYVFKRLDTGTTFRASIPRFALTPPFVLC